MLAMNHLHWIDVPASARSRRGGSSIVAKARLLKVPFGGFVVKAFGTLSVRRGESDREAIRLIARGGPRRPRCSGSSSRERASSPAIRGRRCRAPR